MDKVSDDSSDSSSSSNDSEADDVAFLEARQRMLDRGPMPRKSVSAEAYGNWNK